MIRVFLRMTMSSIPTTHLNARCISKAGVHRLVRSKNNGRFQAQNTVASVQHFGDRFLPSRLTMEKADLRYDHPLRMARPTVVSFRLVCATNSPFSSFHIQRWRTSTRACRGQTCAIDTLSFASQHYYAFAFWRYHCATGHVVQTHQYVLRRNDDRFAVRRICDVAGRHHQRTLRYRHSGTYSHLVTIVKSARYMPHKTSAADSFTFDRTGSKALDTQTVQSRHGSAVPVFADNSSRYPKRQLLRAQPFLRGFDAGGKATQFQLAV